MIARFLSLLLRRAAPALLLAACGAAPTQTVTDHAEAAAPWAERAALGVEDEALAEVLRDQWEHTMQTEPEFATRLGDHRFDDRLADRSLAGVAADRAASRRFLARAQAIDVDTLSEADRITRELFVGRLERSLATEVCRMEEWSLSAMSNPLTTYNRLPQLAPIETPADGANLVARYRAVPGAIDAFIDNLRHGASLGRYANRTTTQNVIQMIRGQLDTRDEEWALMEVLEHERDWDIQAEALFSHAIQTTVHDEIRPALRRLADFLENEIVEPGRDDDTVGVGHLPFGQACYEAAIRLHTSRSMTADELHALGLSEIERIHAEMREIGQRRFGTSELSEIFARLQNQEDTELYFQTEREVQEAAEAALAAAEARMPEFFGVLPQAPCVVRRVPDYEAPFTTIAYYQPPNPDGTKPGEYFVNTYAPTTRPRFSARALAYHEAIPGHHLQIAIAQELEALPAFRRFSFLTMFIEGWALYTERLAGEMGLYETDLDRLGMLTADAWRAGRLVVDTGLHAMGWSRGRAEQYFRDAVGIAENNIVNEIDRYISWPGQALAYKVGQVEILRLREEARDALGERFDIREFHDVVLTAGALTLPVLEMRVRAWIAREGG